MNYDCVHVASLKGMASLNIHCAAATVLAYVATMFRNYDSDTVYILQKTNSTLCYFLVNVNR